ncbi:MAG: FtsX-like permease family protein [Lachnospiraceae bacterium]
MNKKALIKDFFVEIKKTWTRFLSITVMVILGVAFFSGLKATSPDMDLSADVFYDHQNLMDIRVLGTLGLTQDDVDAISDIKGMETVQGGYSYDVFCKLPDTQPVIRLMTLYENMNEVNLSEGRMPQNASECVADNKFLSNYGYQVGDTITLSADGDEDISDIVKNSSLTIVGSGSIPQYLSLERGTTSIGNGELDSFLLLLPEAFTLDAYTEICMTAAGSKPLLYTSDDYEDMIEELKDQLEEISGGRCKIRYRSVMDEGEEALADARSEVAENEQKLLDAEQEIADGEAEIADGWSQIYDHEKELSYAKGTIDNSQKQIADGKKQIEDGYAQLETGQQELDQAQAEIDQYYEAKETLLSQKQELSANKELLLEKQEELESQKSIAMESIAAKEAELESQKAWIQEQMKDPSADLETLQMQLGQIVAGIEQLENEKQTLLDAETELNNQLIFILENENKIAETEVYLQQKEPEITAAEQQLKAGREELEKNRRLLEEKSAQLEAGKQKLQSGISEYNRGVNQLSDAKNTLQESEQELLDAKEEFLKEKEDADEKIADAKAEIADAQKELDELKEPEWYILDRNTIATFVEYGQNSLRIEAIAKVFPVIFFLVATLVCLTTMTRMVEEDRIQIGTLKALGYGKGAIAFKYLSYAFLATLLGSLIGLVLGQKLLPVVIIQAYGIMYDNLPEALAPLHLSYSISATCLAVFCMSAATIFACYKALLQTPASLMRPEAPKAGKRVLLERIGFIWNRLNFTNKSTIRNLLRYKKRFFMTVFGIGGCMALLLVGFGIKDSIKAIGTLQFGEIRIYDGEIAMEEDLEEAKKEKILQTIDEDARISSYLPVYETSMDISDENGENTKSAYVLVPSDNEAFKDYVSLRDRVTQEEYTLDESGVIISEKLAILLDVKEGDTILLQEDEMNQTEVTVSHIAENYFFHYIYIDKDLYESLYKQTPEFRELYTKNADNSDSFEKQLQKDYMDIAGVEGVSFITKTAEHIIKMLDSMDVLIYVIILAAGMLAFVVLYNLNNINISERKRELATLKVLGFYDPEVSNYVFRENVLLTVVGSVAGIFMGIALHRFVILTAEIDNMMFGRNIQWQSYIYSVLLTFLFSLLVNAVMHFQLKRINMVESLKSVE